MQRLERDTVKDTVCRVPPAKSPPAACTGCLLLLALSLARSRSLCISLSRALSVFLPPLPLPAGWRQTGSCWSGSTSPLCPYALPLLYALTRTKHSQGRERARDTPARSVSAGTPTTKPKSSGSSATHSPWACAPRRAFSRAQVAAAGPGCSPGCCSSLALELQATCSGSS
jgi:hypothetical protein